MGEYAYVSRVVASAPTNQHLEITVAEIHERELVRPPPGRDRDRGIRLPAAERDRRKAQRYGADGEARRPRAQAPMNLLDESPGPEPGGHPKRRGEAQHSKEMRRATLDRQQCGSHEHGQTAQDQDVRGVASSPPEPGETQHRYQSERDRQERQARHILPGVRVSGEPECGNGADPVDQGAVARGGRVQGTYERNAAEVVVGQGDHDGDHRRRDHQEPRHELPEAAAEPRERDRVAPPQPQEPQPDRDRKQFERLVGVERRQGDSPAGESSGPARWPVEPQEHRQECQ